MSLRDDVEHLVAAHETIQDRLDVERATRFSKTWHGKRPERAAAKVLCTELVRFVRERESFWRDVESASEDLAHHRENEQALFGQLEQLIEQEAAIFSRLEIADARSEAVIAHVYDALSIVRDYQDPSPQALSNLRDRLSSAADLVCAASRGRMSRALDTIVGLKGVRILAGGAVAAANVAIATMGEGGVISWVSLKAGYNVMKGDVEGLLDLLDGTAG